VRKYLERHAEPEAAEAAASTLARNGWGHVLCIPAFGEGEELLAALEGVPEGPLGPVLVLLVVNEPPDAPEWARDANRNLPAALRRHFGAAKWTRGRFACFGHPRGALLLVDRARPGWTLPSGQGVGLARKIAADIGLRLWAHGALRAPWLYGTDADALLPVDYFERPLARSGRSTAPEAPVAWLYDFIHVPTGNAEQRQAMLHYEIFLRYYVLGLRYAGSPYAYHSLGSTLALAPEAYAMVRGFPRRRAGEDFHLLAKLAKLGPLRPLHGEPIQLSGRASERVPFGTGAGIVRESKRRQRGEFFPAYDPQTFAWLRVWLGTLAELGRKRDGCATPIEVVFAGQCRANPQVDSNSLWALLRDGGTLTAVERRADARQLFARFDALKTLRFLHAVRDHYLPAIPLWAALERAPFLAVRSGSSASRLRSQLAKLEAAGQALGGLGNTADFPWHATPQSAAWSQLFPVPRR